MTNFGKKCYHLIIALLIMTFGKAQTSQLAFHSTQINCGVVKKGIEINRTFEFQNAGDKPIKITKCSAACRCTVPYCPDHTIQPGEKSKVIVTFDSNQKGIFDKKITVYTSNVESNIIILSLIGKIVE